MIPEGQWIRGALWPGLSDAFAQLEPHETFCEVIGEDRKPRSIGRAELRVEFVSSRLVSKSARVPLTWQCA